MKSGRPADALGWRGPILRHFTPEIASVARLTIVADPDQLLTEQGVLEAIRKRGFDLIPFEDHIEFRFEYESRYRRQWDSGKATTLVVVLRSPEADVSALPYDLLETARRDQRLLSFSIGELFPNLAPTVVSAVDRGDFDALYEAQRANQPGPLGENSTKDFVLLHVFGIVPGLIKSDVDLMRLLLERHYRGRGVPPELDDRLIVLLDREGHFSGWPLREIVPNREAFFAFLEERWPIFVRRQTGESGAAIGEGSPAYGLRFEGPEELPFDHDSIRVYIDNLFVEGHLRPTDVVKKGALSQAWMRFGVAGDEETDAVERLRKLTEIVREQLPEEGSDYRTWLEFGMRWAEWAGLRWSVAPGRLGADRSELESLHDSVEDRFGTWMQKHFAALHGRSYLPKPAMVHQIAPFMAHGWSGAASAVDQKRALVVVDGLALSQWFVLREALKVRIGEVALVEGAAFAWVPTLTAVSRQAIFSAQLPLLFGKSIGTTQKEPGQWRRFWEEKNFSAGAIQYVCQKKQEPDEIMLARVREAAEHPQCRVLGVVVGMVDQMMHGNPMGSSGLHAQVKHWAEEGHFSTLVELLLGHGFSVFVTADHGNLEGTGFGKPNVGAIADERGERAHVFPDEALRAQIQGKFPTAISWPSVGLPEDYLPLLAPSRFAFVPDGKRTIAHGGISLEEVIVPFVEIRSL